jgi:competence protein ComEC
MAVSEKPVHSSRASHARYQPLVIVLSAVVAGILADRFWPLPLAAWWTAAVAGLLLWMALLFGPKLYGVLGRQLYCRPVSKQLRDGSATAIPTATSNRIPLILGNILLLLAVAATSAAWWHCCWNLFSADDLSRIARRNAQPICIEAVAIESPRALPPRPPDAMRGMPTSDGTRFTIDLLSLRNGATWQPVSGRATLLVVGKPPKVEPGDRIRCFGRLSASKQAQNPGEFDYAAWLRANRVLSRVQAEVTECVSVVETGSEWNLGRQLARVRSHGNRVLERYLNPRRAELAAAVLLGYREELDAGRNEAFLTTGTIHVLSISGLHVGIMAGALFWIMRRTRIRRGLAAAAIAVVTVLYALMVDVEPPVVRSTILVLVACTAVWLGREPLSFNSLAAAALVVLAINPAHLFHVGAQLSFLCVAGLSWFATWGAHAVNDEEAQRQRTLDRLIAANETWLEWAKRKSKRNLINVTVAGGGLWLLTSPLVLARFHILSLTAIVMNVLLWPLMSLSLLSGFGVLLFGSFCPPLGSLCGWLCDVSFWLLEGGVNLGHRMPCGHFWFPGPADWWLWGLYGALGLVVAFPRLRPPRRWCIALLALWIALGFGASTCRHDRSQLDCTFLSVGHGSAVFIEFPSGRTMLYDAGHMGEPSSGARTISEFLWDRGLMHIDAVVLSHPDTDHYNALPELLEKFSVGAVYVSPVMFEKDRRAVALLREAIDDRHVPVREVRAGERLQTGDDSLVEVLHPPGRHGIPGSENAHSLVLAIEYCGRRIMLPGDLETPGLDGMLAERPRACEVLMAPHHGSRKSNSPALAAWCKPRWVVFSDGGRRSLPEIDATYRAVGGQTLHTNRCGAVRVRIGKDGIEVAPFAEFR